MNLQFFAHKKGVGSTKNGRDSESKMCIRDRTCYLSLDDLKNAHFTKKLSAKKEIVAGDELLVQDVYKRQELIIT